MFSLSNEEKKSVSRWLLQWNQYIYTYVIINTYCVFSCMTTTAWQFIRRRLWWRLHKNINGVCIKCILSLDKKNQFTLTIYSNE